MVPGGGRARTAMDTNPADMNEFRRICAHVCSFWNNHYCSLSEKAIQKALTAQIAESGSRLAVITEEETPVLFTTLEGQNITVASLRPDIVVRGPTEAFAVEIKAGPPIKFAQRQKNEGQAKAYAHLMGIPVRLVSFCGTACVHEEATFDVQEFLPTFSPPTDWDKAVQEDDSTPNRE